MLHGYWVALEPGDWLIPLGSADRMDQVRAVAGAVGLAVYAPPVARWGVPAADAIAAVVPLQVLALELARRWGTDPDGFRQEQEPYRRAVGGVVL